MSNLIFLTISKVFLLLGGSGLLYVGVIKLMIKSFKGYGLGYGVGFSGGTPDGIVPVAVKTKSTFRKLLLFVVSLGYVGLGLAFLYVAVTLNLGDFN